MKRIIFAALMVIGFSNVANSQLIPNVGAIAKLVWDQEGPNQVAVSAYTYVVYKDGLDTATGAPTGTVQVLTGVTCTGLVSPFNCSAPFPSFTPGVHSLVMTATNAAGQSLASTRFSFTFVVVPNAPKNVRSGE